MKEYSFLTSIYKNTSLSELQECMDSMVNQTVKPAQIVIVFDGPVSEEVESYIDNLKINDDNLFTPVKLEKNVGLGNALREGLKYCTCELVARMDTDDICMLDRCEKQLLEFEKDSELSIIGSDIAEFIGDINNIVSVRKCPITHEEICEYTKKRCALNHVTVMFKKSEVERVGSYMDWYYDEDSYLWVRMLLGGCKFANIPENLVLVRIDENTFKRRGGYKYYKSERDLFKFMRQNKIINWGEYIVAVLIRFIVQVLMPRSIRQWFFKTLARDKTKK